MQFCKFIKLIERSTCAAPRHPTREGEGRTTQKFYYIEKHNR